MIIQHHLFLKVRRYDHCDVRHTTSIAANNTGSDGGEHTLANDCRCLIHKRLDDADELGICRRLQQKPGEGAGISLLKVKTHTVHGILARTGSNGAPRNNTNNTVRRTIMMITMNRITWAR